MASKIPCVESQIRLIPVTSFGRSRICHFGENAEVLISEKSKFCVLSEFGFWSWIRRNDLHFDWEVVSEPTNPVVRFAN
jgi:hypothetical protein